MPSRDQHRNKAEHNRRFLATISIDDYPDWVVVAAFYAAVHLVEQLRAGLGEGDSTSHEERLAYVQERHPKIHTAYHILQNASMLARYESNSAFFAQFQPQDIRDRVLGQFLPHIEQYVPQSIQEHSANPAP
jgi:hypothetical protein